MMASLKHLTDDELKRKLKEYGIFSPVTSSTRTVLLKKLNHAIAAEKDTRENAKPGPSTISDTDVGLYGRSAKSNRQPRRENLESEVSTRVSPRSRYSLSSKTVSNIVRTNRSPRANLGSLSSDEEEDDSSTETQPRRSLRIHNNDDSVDSHSTSFKTLNLSETTSYGKKLPVIRKRTGYSPISYNDIKSSRIEYADFYDSESDSDAFIEKNSNKSQNRVNSKIFSSLKSNLYGNDVAQRKYNDYSSTSHSKLHLNSKSKDQNGLELQNSYEYGGRYADEITSPDDIVFQEPINNNGQSPWEKMKKLAKEHCIIDREFWLPSVPLLLVILLTLFFCFLGLCYISIHTSLGTSQILSFFNAFQYRSKTTNLLEDSAAGLDLYETSEKGKQKFPVCELETREDCLSKLEMENVPEILGLLAGTIVPALSRQSSRYQCGEAPLQYFITQEMLELIRKELPNKSEPKILLGLEGLSKLVRINPHWGIQSFREEEKGSSSGLRGFGLTSNPLEIVCLIKSALYSLLYCIVFVVLGLVVVWMALKLYTYFTKQAEEIEQKSYELVEQILEVLENSCGTSGKDFIAVNHVRDCLIPPRERIAKSKIWDRAVRFIDDHDSRVYREVRSVGGEDCEVWRWVSGAPRSPVSCSKNPLEPDANQLPEKIWQGQAFESLETTQNLPHVSPTSCLKVRNMFDCEIEFGDHWPSRIQDSLLEKCEGIVITHVAVDRASKEGCVYVKCASAAEAGKAYRALHGWWFDGKLVTVKYLREERYFERFPTARISSTPLTPSNNKRLSLQPYPSTSSTPAVSPKGVEVKRRSHTRS